MHLKNMSGNFFKPAETLFILFTLFPFFLFLFLIDMQKNTSISEINLRHIIYISIEGLSDIN
jgi:hypothetical protein